MNRMSKLLALSAVAGLGMAAALLLAPAGRAAVNAAPSLTVSHTAADIDHALGAFNGFRNRLDAAPGRSEAPRQVAAIQGERSQSADCARYAWPHIPQTCQTSAAGRHLRQIRTVNTDAATR